MPEDVIFPPDMRGARRLDRDQREAMEDAVSAVYERLVINRDTVGGVVWVYEKDRPYLDAALAFIGKRWAVKTQHDVRGSGVWSQYELDV